MSIQTRAALQGIFVTGAKPTQANYTDWLDSYLHVTDGVSPTAVLAAISAASTANLRTALRDAVWNVTGHTIIVDCDSPYATDSRVGPGIYNASIPFKTIQAAFNVAASNDAVVVRYGVYNENPVVDNGSFRQYSIILEGCTINGWLQSVFSSARTFPPIFGIGSPSIYGLQNTLPYGAGMLKLRGVKITQGFIGSFGITDIGTISDCDITITSASGGQWLTCERCKITVNNTVSVCNLVPFILRDCDVVFNQNINSNIDGLTGIPHTGNAFENCRVTFAANGFYGAGNHGVQYVFRSSIIRFNTYVYSTTPIGALYVTVSFQDCTIICTASGASGTIVANPNYALTLELLGVLRNCASGHSAPTAVNDNNVTLIDY